MLQTLERRRKYIGIILSDEHTLGISKTALRSSCFYVTILKHIFWKTKTFFKKLEYRFLVESTKIENASFPYETAQSEPNLKTKRMVSTKWTYHKERSFASNNFIFFENSVSV